MEVYQRETQKVIRRFLARRIGFPACIAALDAALASLIPHLTGEQMPRLRVVMLANNEIVMNEMERRGPSHKNSK
jgi:enhancing lycopene biosynthesis protein 2